MKQSRTWNGNIGHNRHEPEQPQQTSSLCNHRQTSLTIDIKVISNCHQTSAKVGNNINGVRWTGRKSLRFCKFFSIYIEKTKPVWVAVNRELATNHWVTCGLVWNNAKSGYFCSKNRLSDRFTVHWYKTYKNHTSKISYWDWRV